MLKLIHIIFTFTAITALESPNTRHEIFRLNQSPIYKIKDNQFVYSNDKQSNNELSERIKTILIDLINKYSYKLIYYLSPMEKYSTETTINLTPYLILNMDNKQLINSIIKRKLKLIKIESEPHLNIYIEGKKLNVNYNQLISLVENGVIDLVQVDHFGRYTYLNLNDVKQVGRDKLFKQISSMNIRVLQRKNLINRLITLLDRNRVKYQSQNQIKPSIKSIYLGDRYSLRKLNDFDYNIATKDMIEIFKKYSLNKFNEKQFFKLVFKNRSVSIVDSGSLKSMIEGNKVQLFLLEKSGWRKLDFNNINNTNFDLVIELISRNIIKIVSAESNVLIPKLNVIKKIEQGSSGKISNQPIKAEKSGNYTPIFKLALNGPNKSPVQINIGSKILNKLVDTGLLRFEHAQLKNNAASLNNGNDIKLNDLNQLYQSVIDGHTRVIGSSDVTPILQIGLKVDLNSIGLLVKKEIIDVLTVGLNGSISKISAESLQKSDPNIFWKMVEDMWIRIVPHEQQEFTRNNS